MACLLQPECNFLHGFFRCKIPIEMVDVEVKIMCMQGTHIFRRDWTTQVIKCTPWGTRLCPHPIIIKKMKTFLEVEGKMGPAPASQFRLPLADTNPNIRKDNAMEKRKRAVPKRFRPAAPKPTAMHLPLPVAPPTPINDVPDSWPPPSISVPVQESTQWPGTGKMSGNLFKDRNWMLLPNYLDNGNEHKTENEPKNAASVTSPKPPIKEEEEPKTNDQATEKCGWGPDCPFCKNPDKEDWDGKHQAQLQKATPKPKLQKPQARRPKTLNLNMTNAKQQWEAEMARLNSKYNLDCFSDSELDSESDEGEQYHYEHSYEK